jgi:hypothetical protein
MTEPDLKEYFARVRMRIDRTPFKTLTRGQVLYLLEDVKYHMERDHERLESSASKPPTLVMSTLFWL